MQLHEAQQFVQSRHGPICLFLQKWQKLDLRRFQHNVSEKKHQVRKCYFTSDIEIILHVTI